MLRRINRLIKGILIPVIIVVTALFITIKYSDILSQDSLKYICILILLIGIGFSIGFNRSRIYFIILMLLFNTLLYSFGNLIFEETSLLLAATYLISASLVPINIMVFSLLKERGFTTLWGIIKHIFLLLQLAFILKVIVRKDYVFINNFYRSFTSLPGFLNSIPQTTVVILIISIVFLVIKMQVSFTPTDGSFLGVILALFLIAYMENTHSIYIFYSAAVILLIINILFDSYKMAYHDELTGLSGRRALKEDLLKLSGTYSIAMLDIDFFKKFNDRHGHDVGDIALKIVADTIKNVTGGGRAYRYGGEEFAILFPKRNLKEALIHLEEVRKRVSQQPIIVNTGKTAKKLSVTISIGAATNNKDIKSPQDVMKNADKALYRAKKKGRNCVSK